MQETLELDSFCMLLKTNSTTYDPNNDEFFSLVNKAQTKHPSMHLKKAPVNVQVQEGPTAMTDQKYESKDDMVSMDASTCHNTEDMMSTQGLGEAN